MLRMNCSSTQHTLLIILIALLIGEGDGRWKESNKETLQDDIKTFKKISEKIKEELGTYYDEYSEEPFANYFFEEIDYMQNKIDQNMKKKLATKENVNINSFHVDGLNNDNDKHHLYNNLYTKNTFHDVTVDKSINNETHELKFQNIEWPSFEDILTAMGKKYDWKNDRWIKIKVKNKVKDKTKPNQSKSNVEHQKHNFKYRIVKLNRAKSKRNIVIAVTAIR